MLASKSNGTSEEPRREGNEASAFGGYKHAYGLMFGGTCPNFRWDGCIFERGLINERNLCVC